jgi:GT2 family glycosyltransferase/glycosyltransferase involved in cell wall biosynthesis
MEQSKPLARGSSRAGSSSSMQAWAATKEQEVLQVRGTAIAQQQLLAAQIDRLRRELQDLQAGDAWKLVRALRRCREALAPFGTRRYRCFVLLRRALQVWRREGMRELLFRSARKSLSFSKRLLRVNVDRHSRACLESPTAAKMLMPPRALDAADAEILNEILALAPQPHNSKSQLIDVVIPVYKGVRETLRCLRSVLTARPNMPHELIVINDDGPDPSLTRSLHEIAQRGLITLLENQTNLGFVKTANRGLSLHLDRDVVLLNSDTEVSRDWLERLHQAAYSGENIGTVTPLSNNATICSYPRFCQDNALPPDVTLARLDEICAERNVGEYVEVPTGVGFCMYFRRDCLNAVSLFDEEHFGKGYGEENDFCVRAMKRGWRHLLATDTFVYHHGGTSFGTTKSPAEQRAMKTLERLHPDYPALVAGHVLADPARQFRRRLDLARLNGPEPAILYVLHNLGGGTERHVLDLAHRLEQEGRRTILLRPDDAGRVTLTRHAVQETPNLRFLLPEEHWTLLAALHQLGIDHVHFHHRINLPAEVFAIIDDLGVPYDWTLHDYYEICPRINLIDGSGMYCGEPEVARCQACLDQNRPDGVPKLDIVRWREEHGASLAGARKVFVPHNDAAIRMSRYFPEIEFTVRRHMENRPQARPVAAPLREGEILRVAVIGTLATHKGLEILARCARDAQERDLPLRFIIVGDDPSRFEMLRGLSRLLYTGAYEEEAVFDVLESVRCHCAFFPSLWPETYTYTLSIAFLARLFPVAFDLGAPAARIRECGFGHLIPLTRDAVAINDELLAQRNRLAHLPDDFRWSPPTYRSLLEDYYGLKEGGTNKQRDAA